MSQFFVNTDGGARGNPGPAAIGVVIFDQDQKTLFEASRYIGETTNNVAEYKALITALEWFTANDSSSYDLIIFRLDSQLVVKQMLGEYKVKHPDMLTLWSQAQKLLKSLSVKIQFKYVPRAENKAADVLVNQALDEHLNSKK